MTSIMKRGGRLRWWSLALGLGLTGCKNDNPNYCPGANANNNCAEIDAPAPRCATADDCASPTGACDVASGACAAAAEVAYVAPTGTDNAQCTQAMPCTEIAKALMTNRPYLKLSGETTEQVTITGKPVTLLA